MNEAIATQAGLQRRLLVALLERPAESVSELGRQLDVARPTASRAAGDLLKRGLVRRDGRRIFITPTGEAAIQGHLLDRAKRASGQSMPPGTSAQLGMQAAVGARRRGVTLASMPEPFGGALASLQLGGIGRVPSEALRLSASSSIIANAMKQADMSSSIIANAMKQADMSSSIIANAMKQADLTMRTANPFPNVALGLSVGDLFDSLRISESALGLNRITDLFASLDAARLSTGAFAAAVASAVRAQEIQLASVSLGSELGGWWASGLAQLMPTSAGMLSDLTAMQTVVEASTAATRRLAAPLSLAVTSLVNATTDHFAAAIWELPSLPPVRPARALDDVVVPTNGSAFFVFGARRLLDSQADSADSDPSPTTAEIVDLLRQLDPSGVLADALLGAWDRIAAGGPDWARSAAHQAREALNLTLERLSSDAPPDPSRGGPTRKTRVRFVLGSATLAKWAEAQAEAVDTTYVLLSAEAHTRLQRRMGRAGMAAVLRSVEALLLVLITANRSEGEDGT